MSRTPLRLYMSMSVDGDTTGPDDRPGQQLGRAELEPVRRLESRDVTHPRYRIVHREGKPVMTAAMLTIDAFDVHVPVGTWAIDPMHSAIGFSVRHLMGKVRGAFQEFTGRLRIAEQPTDCAVTATIAASSVNTANRMRDDDLRSANFFDVDQHPDMTFEGTGLTVHAGGLAAAAARPVSGRGSSRPLFNSGACARARRRDDR